jgi:hypothetical protein
VQQRRDPVTVLLKQNSKSKAEEIDKFLTLLASDGINISNDCLPLYEIANAKLTDKSGESLPNQSDLFYRGVYSIDESVSCKIRCKGHEVIVDEDMYALYQHYATASRQELGQYAADKLVFKSTIFKLKRTGLWLRLLAFNLLFEENHPKVKARSTTEEALTVAASSEEAVLVAGTNTEDVLTAAAKNTEETSAAPEEALPAVSPEETLKVAAPSTAAAKEKHSDTAVMSAEEALTPAVASTEKEQISNTDYDSNSDEHTTEDAVSTEGQSDEEAVAGLSTDVEGASATDSTMEPLSNVEPRRFLAVC